MTKAQLINALVKQDNLQETIANLLRIIADFESGNCDQDSTYRQTLGEAMDLLQALENGTEPVYAMDLDGHTMDFQVGSVSWTENIDGKFCPILNLIES